MYLHATIWHVCSDDATVTVTKLLIIDLLPMLQALSPALWKAQNCIVIFTESHKANHFIASKSMPEWAPF